ncbi:hypothetical protein [Rubritalea squalenifaciens]|nr:hypothetical protein [Rubritalea squalenifaciens]
MNNEFSWYTLPTVQSKDHSIVFKLCFLGNSIHSILIYDASPRFGTSWGQHCQSSEQARAQSTLDWLEQSSDEQSRIIPANLHCGYDEKSGFGACSIRF